MATKRRRAPLQIRQPLVEDQAWREAYARTLPQHQLSYAGWLRRIVNRLIATNNERRTRLDQATASADKGV